MKIGVYVGSFNPVHKGHIQIVNELLNDLDKVIIVPTGNYWNKNDLVDINHRINMWKFYQNEKIIINETLNNLKYTYLILNELSKIYNELFLIIGADNLIEFDKWQNYQQILNYDLIIINRNNIDINYYLNKYNIKKYIIKNTLKLNISSTMIRNLIKENKFDKLNQFLDDNVLNYIKKYKLYG